MRGPFVPKERASLLSLLELATYYKDVILPNKEQWDDLLGYNTIFPLEKMVEVIKIRFFDEIKPHLKEIMVNIPNSTIYQIALTEEKDDFYHQKATPSCRLMETGEDFTYFNDFYGTRSSISLMSYIEWFNTVFCHIFCLHPHSEEELEMNDIDCHCVDALAEYYLGDLMLDQKLYLHLRTWMEVVVEYLPYGFESDSHFYVLKSPILKDLKYILPAEEDKELHGLLLKSLDELRHLHSEYLDCLCGELFIETDDAFYWAWNYGLDTFGEGKTMDGKYTYPHTFYLFFMVQLLSGYLKEKYL